MKKIILICSLVLSGVIGFSQAPVQRSNGLNTVIDPNIFASKSFRPAIANDTTEANGFFALDSVGKLLYTRSDGKFWGRQINGAVHYWKEVGSGGAVVVSDSVITKAFANISALRASNFYTNNGQLIALMQGYNSAGDGSNNTFYWNSSSSATDDGVFVIKPTAVSGNGRWFKIFNGVVRAKDAGIKTDGTDQSSALTTLFSNSSINEVLFDNGSVTIGDNTNFLSKKTTFQNSAKLIIGSNDTLTNLLIQCDNLKQCFDVSASGSFVSNVLNSMISVKWFGAIADTKVDGTGTHTNNQPIFQKALEAGKNLRNIFVYDSFSVYKKVLYIPAPDTAERCYYFDTTWVISAGIEIVGDGEKNTILMFKNNLQAPAVYIPYPSSPNYGGERGTIRDIAILGYWPVGYYGGGGLYNNKSHGIRLESYKWTIKNTRVEYFRGHGIFIYGESGLTPITNANNCVLDNVLCNFNQGDGAKFEGGDANNIATIGGDFHDNARWGINDNAFIGPNNTMGFHMAQNGFENQWQRHTVFNNGSLWMALIANVTKVFNPATGHKYHCILNYNRRTATDAIVAPGTGSGWATYWADDGAYVPVDQDTVYADYSDTDFQDFQTSTYEPGITNGWQTYWKWVQVWPSADLFYKQYNSAGWYTEGGSLAIQATGSLSVGIGNYQEYDMPTKIKGNGMVIGGMSAFYGSYPGALGMWNGAISSTAFTTRDTFNVNKIGWRMDVGYGASETNYTPGKYFLGMVDNGGAFISGWKYNYKDQRYTRGYLNGVAEDYVLPTNTTGYNTSIGRAAVPANGYISFTDGIWLPTDTTSDQRRNFRLTTYSSAPINTNVGIGDFRLYVGGDSTILGYKYLGSGVWQTIKTGNGAAAGGSFVNLSPVSKQSGYAHLDSSRFDDNIVVGQTGYQVQITKGVVGGATSYSNSGGSDNRSSIITITSTGSYFGSPTVLVNGNYSQTVFGFGNGVNANTLAIVFDFGTGARKVINEAKWYQSDASTHGTWKIQGSNDNSTYTDIGTSFTLGGATTQTITDISSNTTGYRYYKLAGVSGTTSGSPWVYQIDFKIADEGIIPKAQTSINGVATGSVYQLNPSGGSVEVGDSLRLIATPNTYSTGGYDIIVRNQTSKYFEKISSSSLLTSFTPYNGLTKTGTDSLKLGGTLTENTTIDATSSYHLILTGARTTGGSNNVLSVSHTNDGIAIYGESGLGTGVYGIANSGGNGVIGNSATGNGLYGTTNSGIAVYGSVGTTGIAFVADLQPSSTNTVITAYKSQRGTSGTAANGIGASFDFFTATDANGGRLSNQIISKWTTVTDASRVSQMIFTGVNSATTGDILTLNGNKSIQLNGYGANTFAGTPTYLLGVDGSGNVVETPTGTTGTYTPTPTTVTNVAGYTVNSGTYWYRVGNTVTVSGEVQIDPTTTGATELDISLPIASAMVNAYDLNGTGVSPVETAEPASFEADATNDRVAIKFVATSTANRTYHFVFTYLVK